MGREEIVGTAVETELAGDITNVSTSFTVVDASGWPTGGGGNPFVVTVGKGTASEEKILCTSRTGTTVAVTTRGYDGTTAAAHQTGNGVIHSISAALLDEANAHVNDDTRDDHSQYQKTSTLTESVQDVIGALAAGGAGLTLTYNDGANTWVLDVNIDGSTLEIVADTLREKDGGTTLAKLANLATATVIGRNTAGTGVPEAVTMAQLRTLLALGSTNISDFTEAAQDVIGALLADSGSIDVTYDDAGNAETIVVGAAGLTAAMFKADAYSTYTPTLTADGGSPIIGNGVLSGRYRKEGRTCFVEVSLQLGSTTNFGTGNIYLSLPDTMRTPSPTRQAIGIIECYDASAAIPYVGAVIPVTPWSKAIFYASGIANPVSGGNAVPFTWATGDVLSFSARFETAS